MRLWRWLTTPWRMALSAAYEAGYAERRAEEDEAIATVIADWQRTDAHRLREAIGELQRVRQDHKAGG